MMGWPADLLASLFLFLFTFGLVFSVASLFLGFAGGHHLHLPHGGHHGHAAAVNHPATHAAGDRGSHAPGDPSHGHAPTLGSPPSPINLSTAMVFLTWFGATGYILYVYNGATAALSLLIATLVGLAGATLIWAFLAKVLWRGQHELDPAQYQLEGIVARVNCTIREGGTGEIVYTLANTRHTDGARSVDGQEIRAGHEVVILGFSDGLARVAPLEWRERDVFADEPLEPESGVQGRWTG